MIQCSTFKDSESRSDTMTTSMSLQKDAVHWIEFLLRICKVPGSTLI